MKSSLFLPVFFSSVLGFSQARLVMNDDPHVVIANGAFVVIENSNSNAITETGTGGRIVSEAETNRIRWNISNTTGTYVMPYYDTDNSLEIPFTVAIGVAGTAGGRIDFSTYDGATWDNSSYMPSDVTNMNSAVGGANNSAKVIDRFWIVDATSYATKPSASLTFTYIDAEWSAAGNTITEGNLGAQRFETPSGDWDTYVPQGTWANLGTRGTVSLAPATPANFWRSWTLSDNSSPLPIELLSFNGKCSGKHTVVEWITSSETNNDFFTIEKSEDGISFFPTGIIDGAGNSSSKRNYSFSDDSPFTSGTYYRIKQTDFNNESNTFNSIFIQSCILQEATIIDIFSQPGNAFTLLIDSGVDANYAINIFNSLGQIVTSKTIYIQAGVSKTQVQLEGLKDAMYFINVTDGKEQNLTKKIVIN